MAKANWIVPILKDPDTGRFYWRMLDRLGNGRCKSDKTFGRGVDAERNAILLAQQLKVKIEIIKRGPEQARQFPDVRYSQ